MVILPATFTGSPRHMREYAQDAMTYVRAIWSPRFFLLPLHVILILLSGDFRRTLAVIPRSTAADELNACLKSSVL